MKDFIYPNFNVSILNVSATIASYLGCKNDKPIIKSLMNELNKDYKNIVFICFDGLGMNPININLDNDSVLKNNIQMILTSTFPSTTTSATNSLMCNMYPLEHGWFGQSLYFENINKNINIFSDEDSLTGEKLIISNKPIKIEDYYFDNANTDYDINTIFPDYVKVKNKDNNHIYGSVEGFFNNINNVLNKKNKQFVYAYLGEPDSTMHEYGVTSIEAKIVINRINDLCEELYNNSKDTLFVITADHGQIDVKGYVDLYHDNKLMNMLKIYPFLEARAPSFLVKEEYKKEFEEYFNKKYKDDFVLFKTKDLINKGLFGPYGQKGYLLGAYIAIGTYTKKIALLTPNSKKYKGHHTSLTDEMLVPLIVLKK